MPPKKYIKINGVMKMNPEYKRWKDGQSGGAIPSTSVPRPNQALAVVTNMDDHEQLNEIVVNGGGKEIPLSESTNATIEMMQEPEISVEAGMTPDTMVDELGAVLNKYEVPMGLMNKLMMLSEYQVLEFMIDDSGSMTLISDTTDDFGRPRTRWAEAHGRLKEMIEILAYVPFNQIEIVFLNRKDRVSLTRQGRNPKTFYSEACRQIDAVFARSPSGTTPALEKIRNSLQANPSMNIARWFFGDGVPNGGLMAQKEITRMLVNRPNPEGNPMTFISCTNEDEQVEWMKDAEEVAPYCSESDDYKDEAEEVMRDQGAALPFTRGFHLIAQLVAAMNPDDLDAMDESVPFTKATLDNLLGIEHNEESYRHYFNCYQEAQNMRRIEGPSDQLKKNQQWNYQDFLRAPVARNIPAVQDFKARLARMGP
eukprot:scaffold24770_cov142-Cylindrotheca_fusiformis.AAC.3